MCKGYDFRSGRPCQREAEETVTAGCEHEHIGQRPLCGWHAQDARNGIMLCGDCQEVDGHRCPLYVVERKRVFSR
jgi:hypothetical protein